MTIETLVSETIGPEGADIAKLGHKFDKPPMSLRQIAEETNLGLNTVRTIIAQAKRTDRTTRKHLARVEPEAIDRQQLAHWKRQRRSGNGLPKRINNHLKAGAALIREAGRERRVALVEVAGLSQGRGYLAQRSLAGAAFALFKKQGHWKRRTVPSGVTNPRREKCQ